MQLHRQPTFNQLGPCSMCGKPDGASRGSSMWGHSEMCCSDACGYAYAYSPAFAEAMEARAAAVEQAARADRRRWAKEAKRFDELREAGFLPVIASVREALDLERNALERADGHDAMPTSNMERRSIQIARDAARKAQALWLTAALALVAT